MTGKVLNFEVVTLLNLFQSHIEALGSHYCSPIGEETGLIYVTDIESCVALADIGLKT